MRCSSREGETDMQPRKSSMQSLRDAAILLAVILLVLTVRPVTVEAVRELVPATEASTNISLPQDHLVADVQPVQAELQGLDAIPLDGAPEVELEGQVICRITASHEGLATDCARIVTAPARPKRASAARSVWCPRDQQKS